MKNKILKRLTKTNFLFYEDVRSQWSLGEEKCQNSPFWDEIVQNNENVAVEKPYFEIKWALTTKPCREAIELTNTYQ